MYAVIKKKKISFYDDKDIKYRKIMFNSKKFYENKTFT